MRYPIAIEPGDATHAYGVVVPDLPGCFSAVGMFLRVASPWVRVVTLSVGMDFLAMGFTVLVCDRAGQPQRLCHNGKALVSGPQGCVVSQGSGGQQVDVDITDAAPHQTVALDVAQGLACGGDGGGGQITEQRQHFCAIAEGAAGKFAQDEGMHQHLPGFQRRSQH